MIAAPANTHILREIITTPDDAKVAICTCGWRSNPMGSNMMADRAWRKHYKEAK